MRRILFSHSYFYRLDPKQWKIRQPYPPLMTITAASLMRRDGYEVQLFDVGLKKSAAELESRLVDFEPSYFVIFDDGFNYLTKMCLTTMREAAFEMQRLAKKIGATTITCSSDATDHSQKYLQNGADFVLKGEGELTLKELIENLDSGGNGQQIPGVCFMREGEVKTSSPRGVNTELDSLPQAAWDLVDVEAYRKLWKGAFHLNIATTRGCPYKCNWCAKPIYGNRYNSRSPEKVVEEIQFHAEKHGVDHFWMCDDIFGLKPGWVQKFKEELKKRNLKIWYKIQSRADLLLKEDNINALVESGLDEAWIGAESGSQRVLDDMEKGTTIEQIEKSTELLKARGVKVAFFIQFGYLGETMSDIQKTIDLVLRMMPDKLGVSVSYPLPGTKFYDVVKKDLENKANWTDSDDLDLMFQNTFPSAFYKKLHRHLYHRYRIKRGLLLMKNLITKPKSATAKNIKDIFSLGLHIPLTLLSNFQLKKLAQAK